MSEYPHASPKLKRIFLKYFKACASNIYEE